MQGDPGANAGGTALSPSAVQAYWQGFDLEGLRSSLDERGLAIAAHQDSSVACRKALAERTKEFRKGVPPEVFKQVGTLLKAYQEEVDRLTNRAKAGEGAFLEIFKRLYEAPDPAPAIAVGLDYASRVAELEAAAVKSARDLAEFKTESEGLRNQDLTIRRLEDKVRTLEAALGERDTELEESRRNAAAELEARSMEESRAREARLAEELERAQAGMEAMRRMHQATQAQLFSVQERGEEQAAAARAEADFATAEVERAQEQLATLQRERSALLKRIDDTRAGEAVPDASSSPGGRPSEVAALRDELRTSRELASRLQAELSAAGQRAAAEAATATSRLSSLQAALEAKEAHAAALEASLAGRPTQRELSEARQQVRMLRAVVLNSLEEEEEEDEEGGGAGRDPENSGGVNSLEGALMAKNKHLEHQITMARLDVAEARGEAEAAAAKASDLEAEAERLRGLVAVLETEMLATEQSEAALAGPDPPSGDGNGGEGGGEHTMLSVLCAQRDRLRTRVAEVEGEVASLTQSLRKAKTETEAARADNVALVERLRFVQRYTGDRRGSGVAEAEAGVVGKYMKEYEERVNPFGDFRAREREVRRQQLSLQDRAVYAVGSTLVSGSKVARSAIVAYALILHFVAFLVLAGFSRHQELRLERLKELCGGLDPLATGSQESPSLVDPVVGGALAAVSDGTGRALRRLLFRAAD